MPMPLAHSIDEKLQLERLVALTRELVRELHPQRARFIDVKPSSRIERDLGIDSLGRTELVVRLERSFRVRLAANVVGEAETVADLLHSLLEAHPAREPAALDRPAPAALADVPPALDARTLLDVLQWHVGGHADRLHLTVLQDETTVTGSLTYGGLAAAARQVAGGLATRDVAAGDRVALMLPTSIDFFVGFFGILYAGAIPVPIYPPMRLSQLEDHLQRQAGILRNAEAVLLITMPEGRRLAGLLRGQVSSVRAVESVTGLQNGLAAEDLPAAPDENAIALIQYTSGSTGDPKGVVLTHANLLANIRAMGQVMQASSADVFVSWLPLYHDMGLIGAWLGCLYFGAPLYVMSPLSFLVRPESWLWAMHRYHATLSAAPNFAFELCLAKTNDADLAGLDLSSLRMVANGAEPVSVPTLQRFSERFGRFGFPRQAMAPVYGLAESSVGLAFPPLGRGPLIDRVNREALTVGGAARPAASDDPNPLELAACGQPLPGHEIRIVDEAGRERGERHEGRLEFRGPSATRGYFRNEVKTRELLRDGWLDSGDRAYVVGGDVYITGRIKDIIIRAGRHLYPQDIEAAVAGIPGIRKGGVAVFGASDQRSGTERVVVLAETREGDPVARQRLQREVLETATGIAGTPPDEVVLAPPRSVPKTSSGKIRRTAAREMYESGRIGAAPRALWWQILRLAVAGIGTQIAGAARRAGELGYAIGWWIVMSVALAAAWFAVMLLPRRAARWQAVRTIARGTLKLLRTPIALLGAERIPSRHALLAFNHSSYMDVFALSAALPGEPAFVAKRELARQLFAGPFLRRLGTAFVERYDMAAGLTDADALATLARSGRVLVYFPEGTFTRRPGLSGFYLGAFKVAADAGIPIVPAVIRGTRSMLRGEQWFPRRASIEIEIGDPVWPKGADFASVLEFRDQVRAAMLARCGEPDLDEIVKPQRPE